MSGFILTTPVAFIIFNRPDTTMRVFAEIAKVRPNKLLVVADGARPQRKGETERVTATRAIIDRVDWPCEVLTNFSDINLGCRKRVSSGIDWIFKQVESAIILEDDCLPGLDFFQYCQEMLERYRHDQRIGMISGNNFQFGHQRTSDSYYFSKYVHIWGWASWRDRWQDSYDVHMSRWPKIREKKQVIDLVGSSVEATYWRNIFDRVYRGQIDTWDYQWGFANWLEGRVCILPSVNLVSNIGFGADATHTVGVSEFANIPTQKLTFPLTHPIGIFRNQRADIYTWNRCYKIPLWKRGLGHIRSRLRSIFKS